MNATQRGAIGCLGLILFLVACAAITFGVMNEHHTVSRPAGREDNAASAVSLMDVPPRTSLERLVAKSVETRGKIPKSLVDQPAARPSEPPCALDVAPHEDHRLGQQGHVTLPRDTVRAPAVHRSNHGEFDCPRLDREHARWQARADRHARPHREHLTRGTP